jgi:Holliday junction resolvase RusA-like endonuclease
MITPIEFFVTGFPKGQPRPRAFARNMGGGKFAARVYDSGTAEGWKAQVAIAAQSQIPITPLECPVFVRMKFFMPRPKYHSGKNGLKENAPVWFCAKPDADNLAKAVLDALTQLGLWKDDSQVVRLVIWKDYTKTVPGAEIEIKEATI